MAYTIHAPSAALNAMALMLISTPMWNDFSNMESLAVSAIAVMVWILDEIRHPHPVFLWEETGGDGEAH